MLLWPGDDLHGLVTMAAKLPPLRLRRNPFIIEWLCVLVPRDGDTPCAFGAALRLAIVVAWGDLIVKSNFVVM